MVDGAAAVSAATGGALAHATSAGACAKMLPVPERSEDLGARLLEQVRALPAAAPLLALGGPPAALHLVGGAVRDLLLGARPGELDLVVEGDALALARALGGTVTIHDRFGTCTVVRDGHRYDIARSRRERYPHPGALPIVEPAPLAEDLRRRDFTVGAIALSLAGTRPGRLAAVPHALEDIRARRLRVLHEGSFQDDPTRLLRLARYAGRLGFEIEPRTFGLARSAAASGALDTVSGGRAGAELRLAAQEVSPVEVFGVLARLGLDRALDADFGLRDPALATRALALLPDDARSDVVVLATAALAVSPERLRALLDRLAFPARERELILVAAGRAEELAGALAGARDPVAIAAAACGAPVEAVALGGALGGPDAARGAGEWLARLRHVRLEISGDDLLAAGARPGPALGAALRAALAAKLAGHASDREDELAEALRALGQRRQPG
jgi:tRNA nucleotidyltransferase (CCA-adding enzyme)